MQRLSYPTETVLSYKITRNTRIVLFFKDRSRKPLRRRPLEGPMLTEGEQDDVMGAVKFPLVSESITYIG